MISHENLKKKKTTKKKKHKKTTVYGTVIIYDSLRYTNNLMLQNMSLGIVNCHQQRLLHTCFSFTSVTKQITNKQLTVSDWGLCSVSHGYVQPDLHRHKRRVILIHALPVMAKWNHLRLH